MLRHQGPTDDILSTLTSIIQKEMNGYAMEFAYIWGEGEK